MTKLFTETIRGPWTAALAIAPFAWGYWAFFATGLWQALGEAQSGVPGETFWLQTTPYFTPEQAQAAFVQLRLAGGEAAALQIYGLDLIYIMLSAVGAAALIGFGLRQLGWTHPLTRVLFLIPAAFFVADMTETLILFITVATGADGSSPLLLTAGVATGIKLPAFIATNLLGLVSLVVGLVAWALRRSKPTPAAAD